MKLTTGEEVTEWFEGKGTAFAFDTETNGLDYHTLEVESFQFYNGKNSCFIYINSSTLPVLSDLFSNQIKTIVAHNIVFDLKVLKKLNIKYEHLKLYCTMVADHLIDETRQHGLKYLAKEVLGKEDTMSWEEAKAKGEEVFIQYSINDVLWTWELMQWQRPYLIEQNLVNLFRKIEMPFQLVVVEMETNGILVDLDTAKKTSEEIQQQLTDLECEMLDLLGIKYEIQADLFGTKLEISSPINFNSSGQLAKILFTDLELPVVEETATGNPSVGKKTVDVLKSKHPFVQLLYKYKGLSKLYSAFFKPMPDWVDADGRVRPQFRDTGTKTGRLSCNSPNLQQLPKTNKDIGIDTRECFIVEPGHKMITCDYSGQEVRVMAQQSGDKTLIESLCKGQDMHLKVANQFYNLGIPDEYLFENHEKYEETKEKYKTERTRAKVITFGLAYGKGAFGFSQDFNVSEDEAQTMIDKYFVGMPDMHQAIKQAHKKVEESGYVASMTGRRRHFTKAVRDDWEGYTRKDKRQSFNFLIQGFSADMIRMAGNACYKLCNNHPEWNLKILATVHDEYIFSVREEYVDQAGDAIKEAFETVVKFDVPIVADISIGNNYSEAK